MAVTKVINLLALVSVAFALNCNTCYDYTEEGATEATALNYDSLAVCSTPLLADCAEGSVCYTSKMTFTMATKSYTATAGYCADAEQACDSDPGEKGNLEDDGAISDISALKCVVSKCETDGCNSAMANGVPTLLFAATVFFFLGRI